MTKFTESELKQGKIVAYVLRPDQLPTQPEREWHGKILYLYSSIKAVAVEVLDAGYEGDEEQVYFEQILRVEGDL